MVIPDEDDIVDLVPGEAPGTFVAQLPSFTALGNGWKYVILTPSRGDEIGASVHSKYEVALAGKAGTAGFWEAGDLIGPGAVAAMAMLPDGDVLELGTRKNECYLRRAFTVRAFWPDGGDPSSPAWTFSRKDPPQLHLSRSIFVGPLGEIWAGGWGANNYPAVANINP